MTGGLELRRAERDDLADIARIDTEVFGADTYPALFFRQALDLWPDLLLIAAVEGVPAGYGLGAIASDGRGWILSVAVGGAARRQGLGEALTSALVDAFRRARAPEVVLTVHPSNDAAVRLYERLGFVREREERDYFGDGEPRMLMSLTTT